MSWKDEQFAIAWKKAFASDFGATLAESLRQVLMEIGPFEASALQHHNGRRSLAFELLAQAETVGGAYQPPAIVQRPARLPGRRIGPETTD